MSRRLNTRTAYARDFAARLKRGQSATSNDIEWLDSFGRGRKNGREADGFTAETKRQAALYRQIRERLQHEDEGDVCADFLRRNRSWSEDKFWAFVVLQGYDELRAFLATLPAQNCAGEKDLASD